jgi:PAS domain S-box-containing protein
LAKKPKEPARRNPSFASSPLAVAGIGEPTDANNDLANLFGATEIATVFLDTQLRIKRFTPGATELLNLIASDLGRPLRHITQNFDGKSLSADAAAAMKDLSTIEKEVQMADGRWFTMRILPYRTLDNRMEGAVITFADVSRLKRMEASLQHAKGYAESIVGTVREPLLVLDSDLRAVSANSSFYQTFKIAPEATVGESLCELGDGLWNIPELSRLLKDILPARSEFKDFQVERDFPGLGPRIMRLNARRIASAEDQPPLILLAIEDVTEREQARRQIESQAAELERRVQERTAELARTIEDLEAEIGERMKAAESVQESRKLAEARMTELEHIYNTAPAGLCLLDTELRYVRINERLAAMNGKPVSAHIGHTFREVGKFADVREANARRVLDTGEALLDVEVSGLNPDNRRVFWLTSYLPVKSPDGAVIGLTGMVLDITARKLAEQRIKYVNDLLGLFAQKTSRKAYLEAVVALLLEISGCVNVGIRLRNRQNEIPYAASVGFSQEFLESESRLRLGRDECACTRVLLGQPKPCDMSAMTPTGSFLCGDTIAFLKGLTDEEKAAFRGVCVGHGFASVAVIPIRYRDVVLGVIHLADKRTGMFPQDLVEFMETISPLIGEAAYRFDVEMDLLENEERYRSLVVATSQIVWTTNAQGEVSDDIPSWRAFTGQSLEEIRGSGWADALHPEDRRQTEIVWSHAVETRSLYDTEYRVRRADGKYRDFAVRGVPVIEPDGSIREWVGACTDITERKRADEQLKALNATLAQRANQLRALATKLTLTEQQERERLAHTLHDSLQQLLVGAKYRVDSLRRKATADADLQEGLGDFESLLTESIQLSRSLVVELSPPLLAEVGMAAAVRRLGEEMKRIHGLTVTVAADSEIPADADGAILLLFQAVRELLFNIVKHAGVKLATVRISRQADNKVQVEVEDNGTGFDTAASDPKKGPATGLGLFGIRERIAYLGGHMDVASAPGRGTRVTLVMGFRGP